MSELVPKHETAAGPDGHDLLGAYKGVKLADGSHLKEGASREWGFDDVEIDKGEVCSRPFNSSFWNAVLTTLYPRSWRTQASQEPKVRTIGLLGLKATTSSPSSEIPFYPSDDRKPCVVGLDL